MHFSVCFWGPSVLARASKREDKSRISVCAFSFKRSSFSRVLKLLQRNGSQRGPNSNLSWFLGTRLILSFLLFHSFSPSSPLSLLCFSISLVIFFPFDSYSLSYSFLCQFSRFSLSLLCNFLSFWTCSFFISFFLFLTFSLSFSLPLFFFSLFFHFSFFYLALLSSLFIYLLPFYGLLNILKYTVSFKYIKSIIAWYT